MLFLLRLAHYWKGRNNNTLHSEHKQSGKHDSVMRFLTSGFIINHLPMGLWSSHKRYFDIFRKFAKIFAARGVPPVSLSPVEHLGFSCPFCNGLLSFLDLMCESLADSLRVETALNPFITFSSFTGPCYVQALFSLNCLQVTIPEFLHNCFRVSCGAFDIKKIGI